MPLDEQGLTDLGVGGAGASFLIAWRSSESGKTNFRGGVFCAL